MSKVLFIDCQLLQTTALHRGMGKYTLALLNEYVSMKLPYDRIVILMNDQAVNEEDEKTIKQKLKDYDIVRLPLAKTKPDKPEEYATILESNRSVLDKYIQANYSEWEVDFFITSLFQEDGCSGYPTAAVNRYLLMYDLIPLQFPDYYLKDPRGQFQYLSRYKEMFNATHYFTISKTVANDVSLQLGIPLDRITPIDGSYISRKKLKQVRPKIIGESDKFILMPTGDDARKNNLRAAIAFEEFNSKAGYAYKLVLTSFFGEKTKSELKLQSDHLVFTGNVSEEELTWLYANSELILFPSEYEGLGMPALEAVEFNKPVLCSSVDVFKEISQAAFHYCNHYDVHDMAYQLQRLLIDKDVPAIDKKEYARILKEYSWTITAARTVAVYEQGGKNVPPATNKKQRIAVFAPVPSGYSAIGKVVQEQHYTLSRNAQVDYYLDDGITDRAKSASVRVNYLPYVAKCMNPWTMDERVFAKYDKVIYHIGNSEYHVAATVKALAFPDTVVLHDTRIREMFEVIKNQGYITTERFMQEESLQDAIAGEKKLSKSNLLSSYIPSLINAANRVIVHSDYAKKAVEQVVITDTKVDRLNLSTPVPYSIYKTESTDSGYVLGYAGVIHQAKGLGLIENIVAHKFAHKLKVKIFGFSLLGSEEKAALDKHDNIETIISPTDTRFIHEIESCHLVIGYRPDYHGETSLSTLEALRLGRPVIVNNVGWFKEIPSDLVYKVKDPQGVIGGIEQAIEFESPERMEKRKEYISTHHSIGGYVEKMIQGAVS